MKEDSGRHQNLGIGGLGHVGHGLVGNGSVDLVLASLGQIRIMKRILGLENCFQETGIG